MTKSWLTLAIAAFALGSGAASAQQHQHQTAARCSEPTLACATTATPAIAGDGSLYLAWSAGGKVMVAHSTDLGKTFAPAVSITPEPAKIDSGPDARPKIAIDERGRVTVAYAVLRDQQYNGRVLVSHSTDGGATFSPPQPITADATSQRFETVAIDPSGDVFAAWIDKRNAAAARRDGKTYPGAALAFAWSSDGGTSFAPTTIAADETCECCRLAVAFAGSHQPVIAFRNVFDGHTRDHAVITFADAKTPGSVRRVSNDGWKVDVCPHQGPSLAIGAHYSYHVTWFTGEPSRKGLYYARSTDAGAHFSAPMPVGDAGRRAERPYVSAQDGKVRLVWKEFDGEGTAIKVMISADDGVTWSTPRIVAATADASDQPLLVADRGRPYLSWLTKAEGYKLIDLSVTP
jgi:hypothetical protein